jgi:arabinogalactan endo-1,4-beta-galactosidase
MRRVGCGFVAAVGALALAPAAWGSSSGLVVNQAVGADAGAAAAVTDGDGSTTWCPPAGGAATIDLGRPVALTGAGVTLAVAASQPGAGTPNDNLTLFDFQGHALPSIGIFEDPARTS